MPDSSDRATPARRGRFALLRDASVFQLKLFVDGFRDLVLSPVSIFMALLDFITGGDRFYRLLDLGRRSDRWINLFGTHEPTGLDDAVARVEKAITEQYRSGDIPASARESLQRALSSVQRRRSQTESPAEPATPARERRG